MRTKITFLAWVLGISLAGAGLEAAEGTRLKVVVRDAADLPRALAGLKPGAVLQIGPGEYPGGHHVSGVASLTVEALDPKNPPVFRGGKTGWQFSRCPALTVRYLKITGQSQNGLNLDDGGGESQGPVEGITVEDVEISDIGPQGNYDGIKCSGLDRLTIRRCSVSGWGGQGIDFVGCHKSRIEGCRFVGKEGFSASAGIQLKGGTSEVVVENCRFQAAGQRPLNIGGSTGLEYFRPKGALYEAKAIVVKNNVIEGSPCAAAFVGVDGAEFSNNTLLYPEKWIFRILQETKVPEFAPCRNVVIKNNRIVFRRAAVRTEINSSNGVAAETFRFENNRWFAEDRPEASRPQLPVEETGGVYGQDPRVKN